MDKMKKDKEQDFTSFEDMAEEALNQEEESKKGSLEEELLREERPSQEEAIFLEEDLYEDEVLEEESELEEDGQGDPLEEEEAETVSFFEEASEEDLEKERQERRARWEEKRKKRQKEIRQRLLIVSSALIASFVFILLGVFLVNRKAGAAKDKQAAAKEVAEKAALPGAEALPVKDAQRSPAYQVPGWQYDENGWWYQEDKDSYLANGWKEIEGQTFYFDGSGYTVRDKWFTVDKQDYCFDADGIYKADAKQKLIAMTFDDGPSSHTQRLLDILAENNSKATFFMVGTQAVNYPETVKNMAAAGMGIGNHTWDHTYLYKANPHIMYQKYNQMDSKLLELIGKESLYYRSPGGSESDEYRAGCPKPLIMWSVDTMDWKTKNVDSNIAAVLDKAVEGDIVLMHDLYEATVTSCETIIPELKRRGFKLVTVDELAQAKGVTMQAGVDYYSFKEKKQS